MTTIFLLEIQEFKSRNERGTKMKKFWVIFLVMVLFWTIPAFAQQDPNAPQHTGPHSVGAPTDESIPAAGGGDVSRTIFDSYNVAGVAEVDYLKATVGYKNLRFPSYNLSGNMTRVYIPLIRKDNFKLVGMAGWDTTGSSDIPLNDLTARTNGSYQVVCLAAKFNKLNVGWSLATSAITDTNASGNFQVMVPPIPIPLDAHNDTNVHSNTFRGIGRIGFTYKFNDRFTMGGTFQNYDEYVVTRGNTHLTSAFFPIDMNVPSHDEKTWQSVDWRLGATYKWGQFDFSAQYENSFIGSADYYTHRSEKLRYGLTYHPTDSLALYYGRHDNETGLGASFRGIIKNAKKEEIGYVGIGWAYYENRFKDLIPERHFSNEVQFSAGIKF